MDIREKIKQDYFILGFLAPKQEKKCNQWNLNPYNGGGIFGDYATY